MCGLVGVVGDDIALADLKVLKQLIYVDSLRGHHSTGICSLDYEGDPVIFKKAVDGPDFLQLKQAEEILSDVVTPFVMAHNRYATVGGVSNKSAHPFHCGDIVLCHNGTLTTQTNLPDHKDFAVDSENVAHAIDKLGAATAIPMLRGAFALTWFDESDFTFNIVRNEERTLCIASHNTKNVYYYASERKMLEAILHRNKITDVKYIDLAPGKWVKFNMMDKKPKPHVSSIEVYEPVANWGNYYGATGRGNRRVVGNQKSGKNTGNTSNTTSFPSPEEKLKSIGMKPGDKIEFYATGVNTVSANALTGTMEGFTTEGSTQYPIKIFAQDKDLLAGIYTCEASNYMGGAPDRFLVGTKPKLKELIEGDANNRGREADVQEILEAVEQNRGNVAVTQKKTPPLVAVK